MKWFFSVSGTIKFFYVNPLKVKEKLISLIKFFQKFFIQKVAPYTKSKFPNPKFKILQDRHTF